MVTNFRHLSYLRCYNTAMKSCVFYVTYATATVLLGSDRKPCLCIQYDWFVATEYSFICTLRKQQPPVTDHVFILTCCELLLICGRSCACDFHVYRLEA